MAGRQRRTRAPPCGRRLSCLYCGPGTDFVTAFDVNTVISADCENVQMILFATTNSTLIGTKYDDYVYDGPGNETIRTLGGDDTVQDLDGSDTIDLGPGNDTYESNGTGGVDTITCGPGDDTVYFSPADVVTADCEHVIPR